MAATTWGNYPDAFFSGAITAQMPAPAPFLGTAARNYQPVLGYYAVFTAFSSGGHLPGGPRQIVGILRKPDNTVAAGYKVRLYSEATGQLLDEKTTDGSGGFTFTQLDSNPYYVVGVDNVGNTWLGPIADRVTPALP